MLRKLIIGDKAGGWEGDWRQMESFLDARDTQKGIVCRSKQQKS